jgi:excisionase family DNA binding protein
VLSGDEFAIISPDFSTQEAQGIVIRIANALKEYPLQLQYQDGTTRANLTITLSAGIVQCGDVRAIKRCFNFADLAAKESKSAGKDRVTIKSAQTIAGGWNMRNKNLQQNVRSDALEWLTATEAAQHLKIKPRTLLLWVRQGKLKGYKLSGTKRHVWRFQRAELDAALLDR